MSKPVFVCVLQFEVPGGEVRSQRLPDQPTFVRALGSCRDDARVFHKGDLRLVRDPSNSSATEHTYKVIVDGKVDETEWYVIEEV